MSTDRSAPIRFINYTKEAFFLPLHLTALVILGLITAAVMVLLPTLFGINSSFAIFLLAGLEFLFLGTVTRSKKFRYAVNAKYSRELDAYNRMKELTETYNQLSTQGQRRFEDFREEVKKGKKLFESSNKNFPDMVADFTRRMDDMQLAFARLIVDLENGHNLLLGTTKENIQSQIDGVATSLERETGPLKEMKAQRLKLLQDRLVAFQKSEDKLLLFQDKLSTMEDMVRFMNEQPGGLVTADNDMASIDTLLTEVKDLHSNLSDIEAIMTEYSLRDRTDDPKDWNQKTGSGDIRS